MALGGKYTTQGGGWHFAWQSNYSVRNIFVFYMAGVTIVGLCGGFGRAILRARRSTPRHSPIIFRGRRGTRPQKFSYELIEELFIALGGTFDKDLSRVTQRHFAWQAWHIWHWVVPLHRFNCAKKTAALFVVGVATRREYWSEKLIFKHSTFGTGWGAWTGLGQLFKHLFFNNVFAFVFIFLWFHYIYVASIYSMVFPAYYFPTYFLFRFFLYLALFHVGKFYFPTIFCSWP